MKGGAAGGGYSQVGTVPIPVGFPVAMEPKRPDQPRPVLDIPT